MSRQTKSLVGVSVLAIVIGVVGIRGTQMLADDPPPNADSVAVELADASVSAEQLQRLRAQASAAAVTAIAATTATADDDASSGGYRIDLTTLKSDSWQAAIKSATSHPALNRGFGQFTLMRVLLDGVEPDEDIYNQLLSNRGVELTEKPAVDIRKPAEPVGVPSLEVNGVKLFIPGLTDPPADTDRGVRQKPKGKENEVQVTSTKMLKVEGEPLSGGGMFREAPNGTFFLVEHINSTRRQAGGDPVDVGSFTHSHANFYVTVPPRGQLGILGDVILLKPAAEEQGQIVAEVVLESDEDITVNSFRAGPVAVGGPYGRAFNFDENNAATTGRVPAGEYLTLMGDFDMQKSRWTVNVKPGHITYLQFQAKSQKELKLTSQIHVPIEPPE